MSPAEVIDWRELASCADGYNPELWYPGPGMFPQHSQAVRICGLCPVRLECLELALATPWDKDHGIWGGLSSNQRRRMRGDGPTVRKPRREVFASEGSRRRLRALAHLGWTLSDVVEQTRRGPGVDVPVHHLSFIRSGRAVFVEVERARSIEMAYDHLSKWASDGPYAGAARGTAKRSGWPPIEHWAGVDIDDPRAQPRIAA